MPTVRREVVLPVEPERAWELITDPDELEGWLADEVELEPEEGGELPMSRQAIAKHLQALERAGLVAPRREGRETRYRLTPEPLTDAIAWMEDVGARWDRSLARLSERARRG
jgi:DNA-binding transcriptional ArsR family regulator